MRVCQHLEKEENEDGHLVCEDCGKVFYGISYTEEYNQSYVGDNNNIKRRKRTSRSREKPDPFDGYSVDYHIKEKASELYNKIASGTYRSGKRRGLLAACVYRVYRDFGQMRSPTDIAKQFTVKSSNITKALIEIDKISPASIFNREQCSYEYIPNFLANIKGVKILPSENSVRDKITQIFKSSNMLGIKPQCITAASIYCCLEEMGVKLQRKRFADKVNLTEALLAVPIKIIKEVSE